MGCFLARHFLLAHCVPALLGRNERVALVIAHRLSCSDFRLSSAFGFDDRLSAAQQWC